MKTQIVHISKLQTAKVMALLYLVISIPMVLLTVLPALLMSRPQPLGWGLMLMMPVMYTIFGFIFTFVGAWIYNGVAGWIGGIEFTISNGAAD